MNAIEIVIVGIASTFLMTMFMIVMGFRHEKSIPVLLGCFIASFFAVKHTPSLLRAVMPGTIIHYLIGIAFVGAFYLLLINGILRVDYYSIISFASTIGILAVLTWGFVLKTKRMKYFPDYNKFLTSVFLAHFIFSIAMKEMIHLLGISQ